MTVARYTASTHPGRRRRRNEDAYVCDPPLFAIADGMGGAQAGELASQLAAESLQRSGGGGPADEERVVSLIQAANRSVYERARDDASASGMGTTMTAALAGPDTVWIGHVGDSRAYLVRDHALEQLTEDHSLVAELMRSGRLSPEEAEAHPHRSVITRVLGTDPKVEVDAFPVESRPGDLFMICSDGLSSMVDDDTILELLEEHRGDLDAAAEALIAEANRRGGEDNVTVVLFEIASIDDTIEIPSAVSPGGAEALDEDTLGGLERVPAAWEPVPAPRRRLLRSRILLPLAGLLLAVAIGLGVFAATRANFVGADSHGRVAVYQGVPWDLPFGIRLYREVYASPLLAVQLSERERRRLFDHSLRGRAAAERLVRRYEQDVLP
ncbi:MAG TPA: Stp1/IreP family PP2C-type Ser/Thr phosphatase [Gaiellaceae bacterium]|nr:Stp1/IreP family PP2C-type Ser/Thr phosphatase [Gaiellaceae bacterium]